MQTTPDFPRKSPRGARVPGGTPARGAARTMSETRHKKPRTEREGSSDEHRDPSPKYGAGF